MHKRTIISLTMLNSKRFMVDNPINVWGLGTYVYSTSCRTYTTMRWSAR